MLQIRKPWLRQAASRSLCACELSSKQTWPRTLSPAAVPITAVPIPTVPIPPMISPIPRPVSIPIAPVMRTVIERAVALIPKGTQHALRGGRLRDSNPGEEGHRSKRAYDELSHCHDSQLDWHCWSLVQTQQRPRIPKASPGCLRSISLPEPQQLTGSIAHARMITVTRCADDAGVLRSALNPVAKVRLDESLKRAAACATMV